MSSAVPSNIQPPKLADVRAERITRDDYLGSIPTESVGDMFCWKEDVTSGNADILAFNDGSATLVNGPAYLCAVGTVLADRPYLLPHGNYQPQYNRPFFDTKLQFTLGSAAMHLRELGEDFDHGMRIIEALQIQGATTSFHNHLIREYRQRKGIRMSFNLFSPRNGPPAQNDGTLAHPVAPEYLSALEGVSTTHALNQIPFFDHRNVRLSPAYFEQQLVGSVVEVWFSLYHFGVTARNSKTITSDTFGTRIAQVRVLQKGVSLANPSPFANSALSTPYFPPAQSWRTGTRARVVPSTPPPRHVAATLVTPPNTPPVRQPPNTAEGVVSAAGGSAVAFVPAPMVADSVSVVPAPMVGDSVPVDPAPMVGDSVPVVPAPRVGDSGPVVPAPMVGDAVPVVPAPIVADAVAGEPLPTQVAVVITPAVTGESPTTVPSPAPPGSRAISEGTSSGTPPSPIGDQTGPRPALAPTVPTEEGVVYREEFNVGRVTRRTVHSTEESAKSAGKRRAVDDGEDGTAKKAKK